MIPVFCTDFGDVYLPEGGWPTRKREETRYNEFTGEPYTITFDVPDHRGKIGKKWLAYENYIIALAAETYRQDGSVSNLIVEPFSQWSKNAGLLGGQAAKGSHV